MESGLRDHVWSLEEAAQIRQEAAKLPIQTPDGRPRRAQELLETAEGFQIQPKI